MRVLHPEELKTYYVLPAVRRAFSQELKRQGLDQTRIAQLLGVTPAAVTNYLHSKRASTTPLQNTVREHIKKLARQATTHEDVRAGTHHILVTAWTSKNVCTVCNKVNKTKKTCTTCFEQQL